MAITPSVPLFQKFFQSEKASGFILIFCTAISLILANTLGENYTSVLHKKADLSFGAIHLDLSYEQWINDGLMSIFFLLIGLEIERELYKGELSSLKKALLPMVAALGGMVVPIAIYLGINGGTEFERGFGVPMATDIAFAIGILSLAGNRIPVSLKIFLTALAIIDDIGAIAVIAIFYSTGFSLSYFISAIALWCIIFLIGRKGVNNGLFYIIPGIVLWYLMHQSGVHATIAGVLLAFAIPFNKYDKKSVSYRIQEALHYPVAFFILPLFAFANTAIIIPGDPLKGLASPASLGIILGLLAGKFLGIFGFSWIAVKAGLASLSEDISWRMMGGMALLGGIGFTMSIFITNLSFIKPENITTAKIAILVASLIAAVVGLIILKSGSKRNAEDAG